jgi:hypothetical protein
MASFPITTFIESIVTREEKAELPLQSGKASCLCEPSRMSLLPRDMRIPVASTETKRNMLTEIRISLGNKDILLGSQTQDSNFQTVSNIWSQAQSRLDPKT